MLAALLLNQSGGTPIPPPDAAVQRFGGGPFWRKYGYDSAYDAIREATEAESTTTARSAEPIRFRTVDLDLDHALEKIQQKIKAETFVDLKARKEERRRKALETEADEELQRIFLMMDL